MGNLTGYHLLGAVVSLIAVTVVGIVSGKKVKSTADFSAARGKLGEPMIIGSIVGTVVGGSSTIGAAQSAFTMGFSAWWFTLGAGIGCLVLALGLIKPIKKSGFATVQEIIGHEFGEKAGIFSTLLTAVAFFFPIIAQMISASILFTAIFGVSSVTGILISMLLMLLLIFFGGVWSVGSVGVVKTVLLCCGILVCGGLAAYSYGGLSHIYAALPKEQYFNLFSRGVLTDLGEGLSVILGFTCTHMYIQAFLSGKSDKAIARGAAGSAFMIALIGAGSVLVGLYMKLSYPDLLPAQAFPQFILLHLPPFAGGIMLATLLITVISSGSALSLAISTILINNIVRPYICKNSSDKKILWITRLLIVCSLLLGVFVATGDLGTLLLHWSFLAMAIRAAVLFVPLCCALFFKGKVDGGLALSSSIIGAVIVILGGTVLKFPVEPVLPAVVCSALIAGLGIMKNNVKKSERRS